MEGGREGGRAQAKVCVCGRAKPARGPAVHCSAGVHVELMWAGVRRGGAGVEPCSQQCQISISRACSPLIRGCVDMSVSVSIDRGRGRDGLGGCVLCLCLLVCVRMST